jgi:hypothetical protein
MSTETGKSALAPIPEGIPEQFDSGYVFPTWEAALQDAFKAIDWAYERRKRTVIAAVEAGLTYASIGDAVGMSAAGVHKIARGNSKRRTQQELLRAQVGSKRHAERACPATHDSEEEK